MKKFFKGILRTALILILAGAIIGIIGSVAGGKYDVMRMFKNGELSYNFTDWSYKDNSIYDIEEQEVFDKTKEVLSGDLSKYQVADSSIRSLELTIGGGELVILDSEDENFYLEAENAEKLQAFAKEGTLYVKALKNTPTVQINGEGNTMKLYLYMPKTVVYEKLELELGAGRVEADAVHAARIEADAGAGQIVLSDFVCDEFDGEVGAGELVLKNVQTAAKAELSVGAGHIEAEVDMQGELEAECSLGQIALNLTGTEKDFNYEISCAAGEIKLGSNSYAGLSKEQKLWNDAEKDVKLDCSLGAINVSFTEK